MTVSLDWPNTSRKPARKNERRNENMPTIGKPERTSKRELVSTHIFDAPRELVWKAWTNPNLIPRWWGPRKYSTVVAQMDLLPGRTWRYVQRDADGDDVVF